MTVAPKRCAIYTRKSTEAGLEQDFNSLDAQREACLAYIKSQRHEGWEFAPGEYDDGGFSGGTMERPALKQLLVDVANGRVDVIVVYKIDRLTRSLLDFAKIIEQLDKNSASFVSVTQQFNTTTSMGRLTLNVLLSFAQFEREVTAERIRDKIAASKKKGIWMGGVPPLGYDVVDRQLVINAKEAKTVEAIFTAYLEVGTVLKLSERVSELGFKTKAWTTQSGNQIPGSEFSRGRLYHLLNNPIYIGRIVHKDTTYEGQHRAIISNSLWDLVQDHLKEQWGERKTEKNRKSPCWLVGVLKDEAGVAFKSSQTNKKGRLYHYYAAEAPVGPDAYNAWCLPAREIERIVTSGIAEALRDPVRVLALAGDRAIAASNIGLAKAAANRLGSKLLTGNATQLLRLIIGEVRVSRHEVQIDIVTDEFRKLAELPDGIRVEKAPMTQSLVLPVQLKRRGVEARLILQADRGLPRNRDENLIRLVARAHTWFEQLKLGERKSIDEIAASEKINAGDVSRALPLAFLAPSIVEAILEGKQPVDLTAERLRRMSPLPHSWAEQKRALGF